MAFIKEGSYDNDNFLRAFFESLVVMIASFMVIWLLNQAKELIKSSFLTLQSQQFSIILVVIHLRFAHPPLSSNTGLMASHRHP